MKSKSTVNYIQGDLFSGFGSFTNDGLGEVLSMPNAEVTFYRNFFDSQESGRIFEILRDEINWRQDKMKLYGKDINLPRKTAWYGDMDKSYTVIGSVSFGGTRKFMFRHRQDKDIKAEVELTDGSFLLMAGETQHFWQHQIPKTSRHVEPRINLTFRVILN
jgi:alkylated DNA repair dioxygenase AlkB